MNNQFDIVIIGGGLGGLTAGATLSKKGKKVLLLERHYIPGGCATTFKRKDYLMEVGLHEIDGLHQTDLKREAFEYLDVFNNVNFVKAPELYRFIGNNTDFVQPHGEEESIAALIERFPYEKKGIKKFFKIVTSVLKELSKLPNEKWKQVLMTPLMPIILPNLTKVANKSLGYWLDLLFTNEEIKLVLQANLMYYHNDPYSMSMLYFSAAQASYICGGGHYIKGGSQELSNYLQDIISENGGQVLLGKTVKEITVKNKAVNSVVFTDSFNTKATEIEIKAKTVIANIAVPLVKDLLPDIEGNKLAKKIKSLKPSISLLTIYIGFKKEIKEIGNKHYSTIIHGKNVKTIKSVKQNLGSDWNTRTFIFVDYSQVDSGLAPKGKSFGSICTIDYLKDWEELSPSLYQKKKEEAAIILIDRLEKEIPGLKEQIEYYEVGTAKTIQKFTLNPAGTAYGYAQTPKQSGLKRFPSKSSLKGLYFAGAWTFPGGGFTGAILSGYMCANKITAKKSTPTTTSAKVKDNRVVQLISNKLIAKNTFELTYNKPIDFSYEAGQYAILDLMQPSKMELDMPIRPLSFVSHPNEDVLKFTMRTSSSSFKQLAGQLQIGDESRIFGPIGDFALSTVNKPIVFLVSGIGITPIIPFLKELEKKQYKHPVFLFYSNKSKEETTYHDLIKKIDLPHFIYIPIYTNTDSRLSEKQLLNKLINFESKDYYIIGTKGFTNSMTKILRSNAVKKGCIKVDDFG